MEVELECWDCSLDREKVVVRLSLYKNHNLFCHESFLEGCILCPLVFHNPGDLDAHIDDAHLEQLCVQCHLNGDDNRMVEEDFHLHYLRVHPECKVKCDTCPNQFTDQPSCDNHGRLWHCNLETAEKKVVCPVCKKQFHPSDMKKHSKCHKGYNYDCPKCHVVYRAKGQRDEHVAQCKVKG